MDSHQKTLERMRQNKNGWKHDELVKMYRGFNFDVREGGKHIVCIHNIHTQLRATITRSSKELPPGYIQHAIKLIEQLENLGEVK